MAELQSALGKKSVGFPVDSRGAAYQSQAVQPNPVDLALRAVTQTCHLLERLIVSSETFDYPSAKAALVELERKKRDLARLAARMETGSATRPDSIRKVDFGRPAERQ